MSILTHFQELGFTPTEAKVYLGLAEVGKSTAQSLSKRVKIPRTTAYSALENLVKKGVVAIENKKSTSFYFANQPAALLRLVEIEKQEIASKEKSALSLVDLVAPYFLSRNFSVPKLQFYDGKPNVESLLYDLSDDWAKSIRKYDDTWWGYQDPTFVTEYRPWLEWYWKRMLPQDRIKLISNEDPKEQEIKKRVTSRQIFALKGEINFSSTIWVCGDYIVLIMSRQEPHYAFQIHDNVFAANLRQLFQLLWRSLGADD